MSTVHIHAPLMRSPRLTDEQIGAIRDHLPNLAEAGVDVTALQATLDALTAANALLAAIHQAMLAAFPAEMPAPVAPTGDHEASPKCWCRPVLTSTDPVTGVSVWVHKGPQ